MYEHDEATLIVEGIMDRIRDHIKPGADPKTNGQRYNVVWREFEILVRENRRLSQEGTDDD